MLTASDPEPLLQPDDGRLARAKGVSLLSAGLSNPLARSSLLISTHILLGALSHASVLHHAQAPCADGWPE